MAEKLIAPNNIDPGVQRMVDALTPEYLRPNINIVDPNAPPGKIPSVDPINPAPFLAIDMLGNAAGLGAKAAAPLAGKLSPYAAALALIPKKMMSSGGVKAFDIANDAGKNVAQTVITQGQHGGLKDLWVDWIGSAWGGPPTENALGAKEIRSLIPEIKKHYPEAERIGGFRSGARAKNSPEGQGGETWVKLNPLEKNELIARPAVRIGGKNYLGEGGHFQAYDKAYADLYPNQEIPYESFVNHHYDNSGYVTTSGRFVKDEEAYKLAQKAKQLHQETVSDWLESSNFKRPEELK
jgi:hypothetical protein